VVDTPAVLRGAGVAVAVCLPLALISQQVVAEDDGSPLAAALFLAVLVGFAIGGYVAARAPTAAPFTNGGLAALGAFVVIQGTALVVRLVAGDPPSAPVLVFNALLAFACGLAGGAVASRVARREDV
jgi:putative membrane protein (TIGR04086 family)